MRARTTIANTTLTYRLKSKFALRDAVIKVRFFIVQILEPAGFLWCSILRFRIQKPVACFVLKKIVAPKLNRRLIIRKMERGVANNKNETITHDHKPQTL